MKEDKVKLDFIEFCRNTPLPEKNGSYANQSTYVIEECSELIQALTKEIRGYENSENIIEEISDTVCTIGVYCVLRNIDYEEIMRIVDYKINRAITQNRK